MDRSALRRAFLLMFTALAGVACTSLLGDFELDDGAGTSAAGGGGNDGSGGAQCETTCDIGKADCVDCNGDCETTITNDRENCGACGKSCEGGDCVQGVCLPVLVATDDSKAEGIAVDANSIYWTDNGAPSGSGSGAIMKSPILVPDPPPAPTELISNQESPLYLSVRGDYIYWTVRSVGNVRVAAKTGGDVAVFHIGGAPAGIVTDDTHAYWTSDSNAQFGVYRKPLQAGTAETLVQGEVGAYGIALDHNNVYWVTRGDAAMATGTVKQMPKAGGTIITIAEMQAGPRSVAVDGTHVYWTNEITRTVLRTPIGGNDAPQPIFDGQLDGLAPRDIAIDASGVYWTDASTGGIYRYDRPRGPVTKLASSSPSQTLALDPKRIYWTTLAGVYKLVK